jgi:hypothetical protein
MRHMGHDQDPPWDPPPPPREDPQPPDPPAPPRSERPEIEEDDRDEWGRARRRRHHRDRKERVLHTRISEQLSEDIRRVADDLRVPVSNVVRNVLEEAFGAVERVSEEVGELLDEVLGGAEEASEDLRDAYRRYERRRGRRRERERGRSEPRPKPVEETSEQAPSTDRFSGILGWQALRVNQGSACAGCGSELGPGQEAFLGVTKQGLGDTWLCPDCMHSHGRCD